MNILITNYEYPPKGGGAGNASYFLAREFAKKGKKVFVLTGQPKFVPQSETKEGVTIIRVPAIQKHQDRSTIFEMLMFIFHSLRLKSQIIQRSKPDVILAFFGIPSGAIAYCFKKLFGVPYIVSLRGGDVPGFQPYELAFYHKLLRLPIKKIWHNADSLVANSQFLKALAQPLAGKAGREVEVIPNGINSQTFHPPSNDQRKRGNKLLYVGRLVKQKDVATLIKAVKNLLFTYQDNFILTIAGDGPQRKELENFVVQFCLQDCVTFTGWLDKQNLANLYRQHDIFILPSLDEGMSNALLEAMASKMVVIISDIEGNKLLVNDKKNGLLFKIQDPKNLAEKIHLAINDTDLAKKLANAAYQTSKQFSWAKSAKSYLKLIENIKN